MIVSMSGYERCSFFTISISRGDSAFPVLAPRSSAVLECGVSKEVIMHRNGVVYGERKWVLDVVVEDWESQSERHPDSIDPKVAVPCRSGYNKMNRKQTWV